MPMLEGLDTISKTAVISLVSLNLTWKQYQDIQFELLQHHINFHPDHLKHVWENKAKRFCFVLTLWPLVKVV